MFPFAIMGPLYFPGVFNISVFYYLWSVKFLPDFGILGCMHPWGLSKALTFLMILFETFL